MVLIKAASRSLSKSQVFEPQAQTANDHGQLFTMPNSTVSSYAIITDILRGPPSTSTSSNRDMGDDRGVPTTISSSSQDLFVFGPQTNRVTAHFPHHKPTRYSIFERSPTEHGYIHEDST